MVLELDDVDRGILHALQEDSRSTTAAEMGDEVGVSASTVRNRIERMEDAGVIRGYHPELNYEQAGFQLHLFVRCSISPENRSTLAHQALGLTGVIRVREMMTGTANLHIEAIVVDTDAADDLVEGLADLGLEILGADIVKGDHVQPFNHFGKSVVEE